MNELINRLIEAATIRGLTESNAVLLSIENEQQSRISIYVGIAEPTEVRAPLNLIWIHPETKAVSRRISRESTVTTDHTWQPVTEESLYEVQLWDEPRPADQDFQELSRLVGNPHLLRASDINAVTFEGGQFTGAIKPRVAETYEDDEVPSTGFVNAMVERVASISLFVNQQLVSLRQAFNHLRTRVTAVESALNSVQGAQKFVYNRQDNLEDGENTLEWIIQHYLDAQHLSVEIISADGVIVICDKIQVINTNACRLTFAEPVMGTAVITKVM